jgi:hypothetical protein
VSLTWIFKVCLVSLPSLISGLGTHLHPFTLVAKSIMILVGHSIAFYHLLFIAHSTSNDFLSTLCSKEIANFNRPKAKWYPHKNKIAAQLQGATCSHERMTVILMTLGGKGLKFVYNAVETPVLVK